MNEEHKCKECKWLTNKNRTPHGFECLHPDKQRKWNEIKTLWMGELRRDTARYKQPNAPVCRLFAEK